MMLESFSFTLPQMLSVLGLVQAVYIIVHISMETNKVRHSFAPIAYFTTLAIAFFLDFGYEELHGFIKNYTIYQWFAWIYLPPLSVLLISHLYSPHQKPGPFAFLSLLLPLCAWGVALLLVEQISECSTFDNCPQFFDFLLLCGSIASIISLLTIWANRRPIQEMHGTKSGKERYWLTLSLIIMNCSLLAFIMLGFGDDFNAGTSILTRTLIGLSFVYLTTTSLFRVYPLLIKEAAKTKDNKELNESESMLAKRIDDLLTLDKVYQEPSYSRRDLANELNISEIVLSRIINIYYQKSFPQLMNDHRLEDAKRLLSQTDASIKIIAQEVGFNSLASFNRVFKMQTNLSPSQFREQSR